MKAEVKNVDPSIDKRNDGVLMAQVGKKGLLYDPSTKRYLVLEATEGHFNPKFGPWELPGGRVNEGDDYDLVLEREIEEELGSGITYENYGIIDDYLGISYGDVPYSLLVHLLIYKGGEFTFSEEHKNEKWLTKEEIDQMGDHMDWLKRFVRKAGDHIQRIG